MKISIDDIQLGEPLGLGTVGEVVRGTLKNGGEQVAVKFLLPSVSRDDLVRARFVREMSILERLRHPNIIHYYGGGEHEGRLFYAMEVLDGGNVKDLLDRYGALSWQETAVIARQVCSALQHAHNFGIIHRDLKPSNLFLTESALVKLGDFGIARDLHAADITSQGLTVGTHAYMPPEQIRGQSDVTGKADLYSLGCMLFEMLSGHKPFAGDNFAKLFEQHLFQPPPRLSAYVVGIPSNMEKIVEQLMAKDPEDRPFNARTVQGVMIGLLDGGIARAPVPSSPNEPSEMTGTVEDVGAASVIDPGTLLLRQKLAPDMARQVGWQTLAIMGIATLLLIIGLVLVTRG